MFREIWEKAAALAQGFRISYSGLSEESCCFVDRQMMERAALNMLSNALKFTPPGGEVQLSLKKSGEQFRFCVTDTGSGIPEDTRASLFSRYLREPTIEDTRHGIGLGMLLIRTAATRHRGAVLVDHPAGFGTRITLTFADAPGAEEGLHANQLRSDYAGEQDHTLIELSDFLPPECYQ